MSNVSPCRCDKCLPGETCRSQRDPFHRALLWAAAFVTNVITVVLDITVGDPATLPVPMVAGCIALGAFTKNLQRMRLPSSGEISARTAELEKEAELQFDGVFLLPGYWTQDEYYGRWEQRSADGELMDIWWTPGETRYDESVDYGSFVEHVPLDSPRRASLPMRIPCACRACLEGAADGYMTLPKYVDVDLSSFQPSAPFNPEALEALHLEALDQEKRVRVGLELLNRGIVTRDQLRELGGLE